MLSKTSWFYFKGNPMNKLFEIFVLAICIKFLYALALAWYIDFYLKNW